MAATSSTEEGRRVERDLLDNRFPRSHRLIKSREFQTVFSKGGKIITPTLIFHVLGNDQGHCRLGLAVSRKVGKAVKRNKVKRRIREAFRLIHGSFPTSYDLVVYPRKGILDKPFADYMEAFEILLARTKKSAKKQRS